MDLTVTSELVEALLAEASSAMPREACGLLFGSAGRIDCHRPTANVHSAPETRFEIDPQALVDAHRAMRSGGPRLAGYYHSHPQGRPEPSATDRAMAYPDGMVWAIVGEGQVTFWHAGGDGLEPLPYRFAGA